MVGQHVNKIPNISGPFLKLYVLGPKKDRPTYHHVDETACLNRNFKAISLTLLLLIAASVPGMAYSQGQAWIVNMDASEFGFTVKHLGVFDVDGRFTEGSGSVVYDATTPDSMNAELILRVESVDTDNTLRDNELRGDDFLDFRRYPTIKFVSTAVEASEVEGFTIQVVGRMTIYGETRDIVIPINLEVDDSGKLITITSEFDLHRHDYEMDFGFATDPMIGERVDVKVKLVARLEEM